MESESDPLPTLPQLPPAVSVVVESELAIMPLPSIAIVKAMLFFTTSASTISPKDTESINSHFFGFGGFGGFFFRAIFHHHLILASGVTDR